MIINPKPAQARPRKTAKAMTALRRQKLEHEVELLRTKTKSLGGIQQADLATTEELHQRQVKVLEARLLEELKKAAIALLPEIQAVFGRISRPKINAKGWIRIERSQGRIIRLESTYDPTFPPGWRF